LKEFGTANDLSRLSKPLQSRFRKIFLPKYSREEFVQVLPKINENLARYIGATVFKSDGDIRDVRSIGALLKKNDGPDEADEIINTLLKYGKEEGGMIEYTSHCLYQEDYNDVNFLRQTVPRYMEKIDTHLA
jgi:DNA polymerase III delta prime subunit